MIDCPGNKFSRDSTGKYLFSEKIYEKKKMEQVVKEVFTYQTYLYPPILLLLLPTLSHSKAAHGCLIE